MAELTVRDASGSEIKQIAALLLAERAKDPLFRKVTGSAWRRWLYRRFAAPRYLGKMANTWVLEQAGEMAGYAVVEQRGAAVYVADLSIQPHYDRPSLTATTLERAEALGRSGGYRFVQATPADNSPTGLAPYRAAGFQLLDYYLWAYSGQVAGVEAPTDVQMQPLVLKRALERRLHYLHQELDATELAGRELIDAAFLPSRPPSQRAFEIELEGEGIGFLAPRPNERGDGVLTLVLSLDPVLWGSALEAQIVGGFGSAAGRKGPTPVRLLLSTSAHCERADAPLAAIGLQRHLDTRPVLFKELAA